MKAAATTPASEPGEAVADADPARCAEAAPSLPEGAERRAEAGVSSDDPRGPVLDPVTLLNIVRPQASAPSSEPLPQRGPERGRGAEQDPLQSVAPLQSGEAALAPLKGQSSRAELPPFLMSLADPATLTASPSDTVPATVASQIQDATAATPAVASPAAPAAAMPAFALPPPAPATAVAPLPAPLPVALDRPGWAEPFAEQIHWRVSEGLSEARIEVSPRDLGAVQVQLSLDDGQLRVHLTAEQAATRELLQTELPRLKQLLQQGGLQLADAQVGQDASRFTGRSPSPSRSSPQGGEAEAPAAVTVWSRRRGLVDDYA